MEIFYYFLTIVNLEIECFLNEEVRSVLTDTHHHF